MSHISGQDLSKGLLIVCDGGSLNNQSSDRFGYGSMVVMKGGKIVPSTYQNEKTSHHLFEYGPGVTNNAAELHTLKHALRYAKELLERGYADVIRIGSDSQVALLGATTNIKKPAKQLVPLYQTVRKLALDLRTQVQFIKLDDGQVKAILGH